MDFLFIQNKNNGKTTIDFRVMRAHLGISLNVFSAYKHEEVLTPLMGTADWLAHCSFPARWLILRQLG